MDNITYENAPQKVRDVRNGVELIVKKTLESRPYNYVKESKRNDDFNGIDFIVVNTEHDITSYIDVKSNDKHNIHNRCFSFTTTSARGKSYKDKKTTHMIYVDEVENNLICVDYKMLINYIETSNLQEIPSKYNSSRYVWLNKNDMRRIGSIIPIIA